MFRPSVCVIFMAFAGYSSYCLPVVVEEKEVPLDVASGMMPVDTPLFIAQTLVPKLVQIDQNLPIISLPLPTYPQVSPININGKTPASTFPVQQTWQENLRLTNPAAQEASNIASRGVIQNLIASLAETFQDIVNRQQSLLDLLYCRNCNQSGSPWQNFLNAMANIPALGWVMRPSTQSGDKPSGTFIAATNHEGVVSGVGGSIYNDEPVVEYTFNNNHVLPVKPSNVGPNSAGHNIPKIPSSLVKSDLESQHSPGVTVDVIEASTIKEN